MHVATSFDPYLWNGPAVDKTTFDLEQISFNAFSSSESATKISILVENLLATFSNFLRFRPAIAHLISRSSD